MDALSELLKQVTRFGGEDAWVYQVFFVVLTIVVANFVLKLVLAKARRQTEKTRTAWDDALLHALQKPARLLVWVVGLTFAAEIVQHVTDAVIWGAIGPVRDIGVIASVTWFITRFIHFAEKNIVEEARLKGKTIDKTTADAVARLLRISVLITAVLVTLQTLGYSISGVLAFGGIGGLAVGFAAKDLLANFFGGMMIFLDRPFAVGDWIRSPDREIEGTVEHIGWRLTCIRTFDKRPLYVPNSVFANIALQNPSRMTHRRIYETIGIRYDDVAKLDVIVAEVKQMLHAHEAIDDSQTLMVNFNAFGPSSLDFFIYTMTHTTVWSEFHEIKQDVLLRIHAIIARHGAEIAFPTSTVHLPDPVQLHMREAAGQA